MPRTVLTNARIRTMWDEQPAAHALAVEDGRIVALGDDALALADGADVVDLGGRAVMPGLVDVHDHFWLAGVTDLFELDFDPATSVDGIVDAVAAHASRTVGDFDDDGEWIVGGSWGSGLFEALQRPGVLERLDEASAGRPLMLRDDSKHNRLVNTEAMRRAGIGPDTPDPTGGQILRDAEGRATGVLIEAGGLLVESARNAEEPLSPQALARGAARGIEILSSHGFTAVQEAASSLQLLEAIHLLDSEGRLDAHVVTSAQVNDFIFGTDPLGAGITDRREEFRSPHHHPDFVKILLDGVPPSYTAAFLEPYVGGGAMPACPCGSTTMPYEELETVMVEVARQGLGIKVHCTGDASARFVLDATERLRDQGLDVPVHIAHGQFVQPDDVPRMARLDVTADTSPSLFYPGLITDAIADVVPAHLFARIHPTRELRDAGARIAWGSDWPVSVSPNPWEAVYGLVHRSDPEGRTPGTLAPDQALTLDEALEAVTSASAEAMGLGDVTGRIRPGMSADLVVLSADPADAAGLELARIHAEETWFAGRRVYARGR